MPAIVRRSSRRRRTSTKTTIRMWSPPCCIPKRWMWPLKLCNICNKHFIIHMMMMTTTRMHHHHHPRQYYRIYLPITTSYDALRVRSSITVPYDRQPINTTRTFIITKPQIPPSTRQFHPSRHHSNNCKLSWIP